MGKLNSICRNILLVGFVMMTLSLAAQSKKVLIVSLEDTTMVHGHRGFTAITNFKDTLRMDMPFSKFIEGKLNGYLKTSFETQVINAPAEIRKNAFGFWGKSKEYKNWIAEVQKGYDYLIIVHNIDISNGTINPAMPANTSGFFSGGPVHGVFSTISFDAYQIANNQKLEYDNWECKFCVMMKKFKMPEDKRTFDNQMLEVIKNELIQLIDNKIKFFLTETSLVPNLE